MLTVSPRATYRLQFHKGFGFDDAARVAPYLRQLGISHVYASPWLKARAGSSHGYDTVDHHALNPELGDQSSFDAMIAVFHAHGLGTIMDCVPNHMGVGGSDNPLWLDVLEWGPESAHAGWFDIDWQSDHRYLHDKLLVPLLSGQYGLELYAGKLQLKFDIQEGSFAVWAYDVHKLPICPLHYNRILGVAHPELERLGDAFSNASEGRPQAARRTGELKAELADSAAKDPAVREAVAAAMNRFQGIPGNEESWKALHELIQDQYWRAADFRVAGDDINYRRFFDVNELAGLRMELPDVFEHTHELIFKLLAEGKIDGLRIDHVDGLLDPKQYFERIRTKQDKSNPPYLVVEKILANHETLREDWPVDGTTGYEFANLVLGLLIDPSGQEELTLTYLTFTGSSDSFAEVVRECKLRIMRHEMASELNMLAREAVRIAQQNPKTADFTQNLLRRAIRDVIACFPVYRTYVDANGTPTVEDRRDLDWAMKQARTIAIGIDPTVFDFVAEILSGDLVAESHSGFSRQSVLRCAMKLQQYSGPVMAKGLEDTAFYRYNRFVVANEVGGHPDQLGVSISHFHKANVQRLKRWPNSMLATSTHDTKRGEDARARLAVLSEMPQEWVKRVNSWSRILRARRADLDATAPPDRNDEYLLYQLLIGTWPVSLTAKGTDLDPEELRSYSERIKAAMTKSIREAKVHSTWAYPNAEYENAVSSFIEMALAPTETSAFLSAFLPFQEQIARLGVHNSLIQTTMKLTAPGVPDIYQGADLWDLSLVDPDNRRPVDYLQRARMLSEIQKARNVTARFEHWQDGSIKMLLIHTLLQLRAEHAALFEKGDYEPIVAAGDQADCVCGFTRRIDDQVLLVLTARFPFRLQSATRWSGTTVTIPKDLGAIPLRNILTEAELPISDGAVDIEAAFTGLPVSISIAH